MSKFEGRKCDRCGAIHPNDEVTKKTISYKEGTTALGSIEEDLCPKCSDKELLNVTLKAPPGPKKKSTKTIPTIETTATPSTSL